MVSKIMLERGTKRSVIREIFEYGRARKAEIGAENVFDFSLGNPSVPAPEEVTRELTRLISSCDPAELHGYTSAPGAPAVREAVAAYVRKEYGFPADAELIYMTAGAAAALTTAFTAILSPGEEVAVCAPFFPEYRVFAEQCGARLIAVPSEPLHFQIDFDALERAFTPRTHIMLVNSPNNPSGAVLTEDTVRTLAAFLRRKEAEYGHEIYLLSDEPYRELVYGDKKVPYLPLYYDNTLVCYSFSKSLSLPGERIGYLLVSPRAKDAKQVFAAICGAGRSLGYVCAPALFQYLIPACLGKTADLSVYRENRTLLYDGLTACGYSCVPPDGAFYLFVRAPEPDAAAFCERAKKFELLLVPGDDFGMPGYVRIAYCVKTEQIRRSLPAFRALAESYR